MTSKRKQLFSFFIAAALILATIGTLLVSDNAAAFKQPDTATFTAALSSDLGDGIPGLPLQVVPPDSARIGESVTLTIRGDGAQGLTGFQFALQYDDANLDFYKAEVSDELKSLGVDILAMGPVRHDGVVYFGAAACPVADCSSYDYGQPKQDLSEVAAADIPLVNFHFYVRAAGTAAFELSEAQLIDAKSASLLAQDQAVESVSLAQLDLTGNHFVNDSDAWAAVGAWADLIEDGRCMTPALAHYDINQSGCIDIADVQLILDAWGQNTDGSVPAGPAATTDTLILVVDSTGDGSDATLGDGFCATVGGDCTLRAAIEESNARPGYEEIHFDVRNPNDSCPDLVVIQPATSLTIDDKQAYGLTIDGYTQCGASPNTQPVHGDAVIKVEIAGNETEGIYGLFVNSPNNTIKGLALYDWNYQILLRGARSQYNQVEGNFISTNAANDYWMSFPGENDGLRIDWSASNNTIGGDTPAQRNLISGGDQDGLGLQGPDVSNNLVIGNYIGLAQDGTTALRNQSDGVDIAGGAHNNQIGGLNPGERNVIGGNNGDGIEISHDGTNNNEIVGNLIGLNATGNETTRNRKRGITFEDIVYQNDVHRNIIVDNGGIGVRFYTADDNDLYDNFIGVYPSGLGPNDVVPLPGTVPLANLVASPNGALPEVLEGLSGISLLGGSKQNFILHNIVAHHPEHGVLLRTEKGYLPDGSCTTYYNTISENSIFDNGLLGIHLQAGMCDGDTYVPNEGIPAPVISIATTSLVTGTACPNCVVELFIADKDVVDNPAGDNYGEGKVFIASGTADANGDFSIPVAGFSAGDIATGTSTDPSGNTSEFARNVIVSQAVETPTPPTPTETSTPTGTVTSEPPTATPTATPTGEPGPTETPQPGTEETISLPLIVK